MLTIGLAAGCNSQTGDSNARRIATNLETACKGQSHPALTGRVVDGANILAPRDEAAMSDALTALEAKTQHQLVVVTVPSLQNRSIKAFSRCLATHWGIGRKNVDDGIMIALAPVEQRVRIEVGRGLESRLTDGEAKTIIDRDMIPAFRAQRYDTGLMAGIDAVSREIGG